MNRLGYRWIVGRDDLTGGWCVFLDGDAPTIDGTRVVGDFDDEETARHVADVHNAQLM